MKGHLDDAGTGSREEARIKAAKMVETRTKLLLFPLCPQPRGLSSMDDGGGNDGRSGAGTSGAGTLSGRHWQWW